VQLEEPIIRVLCGGFHTIAFAASRNLYSWGGGIPGTGVGENDGLLSPAILGEASGKTVISIQSGMFSSLIVAVDRNAAQHILAVSRTNSAKKQINKARKGYPSFSRIQAVR
jgi:hypothetical protein